MEYNAFFIDISSIYTYYVLMQQGEMSHYMLRAFIHADVNTCPSSPARLSRRTRLGTRGIPAHTGMWKCPTQPPQVSKGGGCLVQAIFIGRGAPGGMRVLSPVTKIGKMRRTRHWFCETRSRNVASKRPTCDSASGWGTLLLTPVGTDALLRGIRMLWRDPGRTAANTTTVSPAHDVYQIMLPLSK
jgi:hypothetical protein